MGAHERASGRMGVRGARRASRVRGREAAATAERMAQQRVGARKMRRPPPMPRSRRPLPPAPAPHFLAQAPAVPIPAHEACRACQVVHRQPAERCAQRRLTERRAGRSAARRAGARNAAAEGDAPARRRGQQDSHVGRHSHVGLRQRAPARRAARRTIWRRSSPLTERGSGTWTRSQSHSKLIQGGQRVQHRPCGGIRPGRAFDGPWTTLAEFGVCSGAREKSSACQALGSVRAHN